MLGVFMKSLLLTLILFSSFSYSFDYDGYEKETLDGVISRSNEVLDLHIGEEGVDIINPVKPFSLYETIEKMPYECDSSGLLTFMGVIGFNKETLPPITHCIKVKSTSGVSITFYVQDTLVEYLRAESEVGKKIQIWAIWVFSNGYDRLPRLLMNEFDAVPPNKSIQPTAKASVD